MNGSPPRAQQEFNMKRTHGQKCPICGHLSNKDGFTPTGRQRYECPDCGKKFSVPPSVAVGGFGGYLRGLREGQSLTQQQVSEFFAHDRAWWNRIESGKRNIGVDELFRLGEVFQMRASEIVAGYERLLYPD